MQEKLWYFSGYDSSTGYPIKEALVIKETEKQYITDDRGWKRTINKSTMENGSSKFYTTKEACEQGLISYMKKEIEWAKDKIRYANETISKRKSILKERFNIEVE